MATDTHTSDKTFDLISASYHALQAAETYEQYIRDADERGDQEVAQFFRDAHGKHVQVADGAKHLLKARLTES